MSLGAGSTRDLKRKTKKVRQSLKSLLRQDVNRNSVALWECYARFEWSVGNVSEARRMLDTALRMQSTVQVTDVTDLYGQCVTCRLYRTYASMELGTDEDIAPNVINDRSRCLNVLVALVEGVTVTVVTGGDSSDSLPSTRVLKCSRMFEQRADVLFERFVNISETQLSETLQFLDHAGDILVHWTACHSLFKYLTSGRQAATEVFVNLLSNLRVGYHDLRPGTTLSPTGLPPSVARYRVTVRRLLTEAYVNFLRYDVDHCNTPTRFLREPLLCALAEFPVHRSFLQLLLDIEEPSHITGTLNRYFTDRLGCSSFTRAGNLSSIRRIEDKNKVSICKSEVVSSLFRCDGKDGGLSVGFDGGDDRLVSCLYAVLTQVRRLRRIRAQSVVQCPETG